MKRDTLAVINFALNNLIKQTEALLEKDKDKIVAYKVSEEKDKLLEAEANYKRHYKNLEQEHEAINDFKKYVKELNKEDSKEV